MNRAERRRFRRLRQHAALSPQELSRSLLSLQRWGFIEIAEPPNEAGVLPEEMHIRSLYSVLEFLEMAAELDPRNPATWPKNRAPRSISAG